MTAEIRFWKIENDKLAPVSPSKLDLEQKLEDWLEKDIAILDRKLLVIGRQVPTAYGKYIDLLCMDAEGDLVIVELKRGMTPREVTAQALDYASWVQGLSREQVVTLADAYLRSRPGEKLNLEERFRDTFKADLPEVLNGAHSMLVVAAAIDESTERIIRYLSETYGVGINAATFQVFESGADKFLGRVFLIPPGQVEQNSSEKAPGKRARNMTMEELAAAAKATEVSGLYHPLVHALSKSLKKAPTRTSLAFSGEYNGMQAVMIGLIPTQSSAEQGLKFQIYLMRFTQRFGVSAADLIAALPETKHPWAYVNSPDPQYGGYEGFFRTPAEVERFCRLLGGVVVQADPANS